MIAVLAVPDRTESEWAMFWRVYIEALEGFPADVVRKAVRAYLRSPDSEFFPKPGPLHALCLRQAHDGLDAADRRDGSEWNNRAWSWPSDEELASMTLREQRRQYQIMASQSRGKAGSMASDGKHPRPEWIIKAQHYEAEAQRIAGLISRGAQADAASRR